MLFCVSVLWTDEMSLSLNEVNSREDFTLVFNKNFQAHSSDLNFFIKNQSFPFFLNDDAVQRERGKEMHKKKSVLKCPFL